LLRVFTFERNLDLIGGSTGSINASAGGLIPEPVLPAPRRRYPIRFRRKPERFFALAYWQRRQFALGFA
jgi:hypothetical protein